MYVTAHEPLLEVALGDAERAARRGVPVLLRGGTGTGKEALVWRAHCARFAGQTEDCADCDARGWTDDPDDGHPVKCPTCRGSGKSCSAPFVLANVAGFTEDSASSEFFGHVRGAFTGALADRVGAFVRADGGTLYIPDFTEMSPKIQASIYSALDTGRIQPVGASVDTPVHVYMIASASRDLREHVTAGELREDTLHRMPVIVEVPSLSQRSPLHIRELCDRWIERHRRRTSPTCLFGRDLADDAFDLLVQHPFPGNVRQLQNFLELASIRAEGRASVTIEAGDLMDPIDHVFEQMAGPRPAPELLDPSTQPSKRLRIATIEMHLARWLIGRPDVHARAQVKPEIDRLYGTSVDIRTVHRRLKSCGWQPSGRYDGTWVPTPRDIEEHHEEPAPPTPPPARLAPPSVELELEIDDGLRPWEALDPKIEEPDIDSFETIDVRRTQLNWVRVRRSPLDPDDDEEIDPQQ